MNCVLLKNDVIECDECSSVHHKDCMCLKMICRDCLDLTRIQACAQQKQTTVCDYVWSVTIKRKVFKSSTDPAMIGREIPEKEYLFISQEKAEQFVKSKKQKKEELKPNRSGGTITRRNVYNSVPHFVNELL